MMAQWKFDVYIRGQSHEERLWSTGLQSNEAPSVSTIRATSFLPATTLPIEFIIGTDNNKMWQPSADATEAIIFPLSAESTSHHFYNSFKTGETVQKKDVFRCDDYEGANCQSRHQVQDARRSVSCGAAHAKEGIKERQQAQTGNDRSRTGVSDSSWTKADQTGWVVFFKIGILCLNNTYWDEIWPMPTDEFLNMLKQEAASTAKVSCQGCSQSRQSKNNAEATRAIKTAPKRRLNEKQRQQNDRKQKTRESGRPLCFAYCWGVVMTQLIH